MGTIAETYRRARLSALSDTELPAEATVIARLKGEPYVVFDRAQQAAVSDTVIDLHDYNAVVIKILVSGAGASADVMLVDAETAGGIFLPCTDQNSMAPSVTQDTQVMAMCGAHYARIMLANVAGTFAVGQGFTVIVWPFVAAGQSDVVTNIGAVNLPLGVNLPVEIAAPSVVPVADTRLPAALGPSGGVRVEDVSAGARSVQAADGAFATVGTTTDAEAPADGTLVGLLKRLRTLLGGVLRVSRGYAAASATAYGTSTAPALGAAIATLAAPGAGTYEVQAQAGFLGTVAAGDVDNFELRHGATRVGTLPAAPVANSFGPLVTFPRVVVAAGEAISINATAAGVAASIYRGLLVVTAVN